MICSSSDDSASLESSIAFEVVEVINHIALLALPPAYHEQVASNKAAIAQPDTDDDDEDDSSSMEEHSMDLEHALPAYKLHTSYGHISAFLKELMGMALQTELDSINLSVGIFCGLAVEYLPREEHVSLVQGLVDQILKECATPFLVGYV